MGIMMAVVAANYEQSSNFKVLATETISLFDNDVIEMVGSESFSSKSAQGHDYAGASQNSGMPGMNHHSNQMLGSMSSRGSYSMGSTERNTYMSNGAASERSMNTRSSSLSSGSQSKPMIRYVATEGGNSNTVFTQNSGSTGNNEYY